MGFLLSGIWPMYQSIVYTELYESPKPSHFFSSKYKMNYNLSA